MLISYFMGLKTMIAQKIADAVLAKMGLEKEHIEKAKAIIDMLEFTKEDGLDVIKVNLGDNPIANISNGDKRLHIDIGENIHVIIDKSKGL